MLLRGDFALTREGELVLLHREVDLRRLDPGEVDLDTERAPVHVTGDLRDIAWRSRALQQAGVFPVTKEGKKEFIHGVVTHLGAAEGKVPGD